MEYLRLEFGLRGVSNATPGTTPVTLSLPSTSTPGGPFACGSFQVHLFMSECQFTGYLYLLYIVHSVVCLLHLIRIQILTWFRKDDSTVWNKAENTFIFIQITGLHHRRALHSSPSPQGVSASLPPSRQLSNGDGVIVSPIRPYHAERGEEMRLRKVQGDAR